MLSYTMNVQYTIRHNTIMEKICNKKIFFMTHIFSPHAKKGSYKVGLCHKVNKYLLYFHFSNRFDIWYSMEIKFFFNIK